MKLVDDWKEAWSWFSIQIITVAFVWEALPEETKSAVLVLVPDAIEPHMTAILLLVAAVGRVLDQGRKPEDVAG